MKIIVISDTHGDELAIREVLSLHPRYDALVFLGDGLRDISRVDAGGIVAVRGNCDFFSTDKALFAPTEQTVTFDGVRLLLMHGHESGVKSGIERACARAVAAGADVLLFGHTHVPLQKYFPEGSEFCGTASNKALYAFNPGSLGRPTEGYPSFGVIEIRNSQVLLSHGYLKK